MALMKLVSPHTLVYLSIFLCFLVDLGNSEDVPYTFEGESPEPIVIIDGHNIYKRAVDTNDTTNNNGVTTEVPPTTAGPNVPQSTAAPPPPTTQAPVPTTKAPSGGGVTTEPTTPLTTTILDDHKYYHSQILPPEYIEDHWVEQKDAVKHKTLSNNYRVAVSVQMSFKFRFYGHEINSVTIATGGFLYMSPFLHKWLTATQYIAPLMGNFDTTLGNTSEILYKDYNDMFIVEWSDIYLQDQNHTNPFVFQTQLYDNGTIKFIYKKLPLPIEEINRSSHPVKIGLSDAYYIDSSVNGKNRRTIYEYHRVEVDTSLVKEGTVIILHPKKTCNLLTDCDSCVTDELGFDCKWCGEVQRCSDGVDWNRQTWREKGCTTKIAVQNFDVHIQGIEWNSSSLPTGACYPVSAITASAVEAHDNVTLCVVTTNTTQVPTTITLTNSTTRIRTSVPPGVTTKRTTLPVTTKRTTPPVTTKRTTPPPPVPSTKDVVTMSGTVTMVTPVPRAKQIICDKSGAGNSNCDLLNNKNKDLSIGIVIAVIVILLILIGSIGGWVFYAYRNPQSSSGMWLMEHRPSQMKQKMAKMKFWKKTTSTGEKYEIRSEAEA